ATGRREQSNVAGREPGRIAALRHALEGVSGTGTGAMTTAKPDRDAIEKLAALGYIGATSVAAAPSGAGTRPDPKKMIGTFNRLREANRAVTHGLPAQAEAAARDVLNADQQNAFATLILARAQMQLGRCPDAIASYRRYAALVPTSAGAHHAGRRARTGRPCGGGARRVSAPGGRRRFRLRANPAHGVASVGAAGEALTTRPSARARSGPIPQHVQAVRRRKLIDIICRP